MLLQASEIDQDLSLAVMRMQIRDSASLTEAREHFARYGFVKVNFMIPASIRDAVATEVLRLVEESAVRRDIVLKETDNSPRRMSNVRQREIHGNSPFIREVYSLTSLYEGLALVAGEPVLPCPYEPEQYVITRLDRAGDTHGWHWDDYSFALVWVAETPDVDDGGFVQCVPGTSWNKSAPRINHILATNPIHGMALYPGDVYLMRTTTTLHRVYPLRKGRRTIINMGFAAESDLLEAKSHETTELLWELGGAGEQAMTAITEELLRQ